MQIGVQCIGRGQSQFGHGPGRPSQRISVLHDFKTDNDVDDEVGAHPVSFTNKN